MTIIPFPSGQYHNGKDRITYATRQIFIECRHMRSIARVVATFWLRETQAEACA